MADFRLYLLGVICSIFLAAAVDRTNFKTCSQSGFCKRHRALSETKSSPYMALLSTLTLTAEGARFHIRQTEADISLLATLSIYSTGVTRLVVDELSPVSPRYRVPPGDVVLEGQKEQEWNQVGKDSNSVTLERGTTKIYLQSKPFRLDYYVEGNLVTTLNSRGLMKFEHLRIRPGVAQKAAEVASSLGSKIYSWVSAPFSSTPEEAPKEPEDQNNEEDGAEEGQEANGETTPPPPEDMPTEAPTNENAEADEAKTEEPDMWEETFKSHTDSKPKGPTSLGVDLSFVGFQHVYGVPEHADSFALRSTRANDGDPYRLYNLDVFEYELHNPMALYGSVPVMLAHNSQITVGIFWNNPSETWIDVASSTADKGMFSRLVDMFQGDSDIPQMNTHWFSESGVLDLYFMPGPTPLEVFSQYAKLTGTTALPPLFSLAYHQSRWNYNDEADVQQINENYDLYDMPMDVVWLDIEHTNGKRYFTWDGSKFPDSLSMIKKLTDRGRKLVTIVDPHIKRDSEYKIHKEAGEKDLYVKDKSGNEYDGWCWPGSASYLDFTSPEVRAYWASKFTLDEYQGTTVDVYTWNDMNEPSVFNGPEITMHKDCVHKGGWEHRDVHNLYGMYQQQATAEGQVLRSNGQLRPFVLSRAFYSGSQRWGAIWTGDNTGEWGHLKISVPMILSLSITGVTFSGADIGGFFRNPDHELTTRWYQAGAYQPFFRGHSHMDTRRREPWLLPDEHRDAIKAALKDRYALLPYWYTLFYHGELHGSPPARPIWVEFPAETALFAEEEAYMVGPALLVRPVLDAGLQGVTVNFPGGPGATWYDVDTYQSHQGGSSSYVPTPLSKIPVFHRGGTIIPRKNRARRSTAPMANDPYTLVVALSPAGAAEGDLYIDDYESFKYRQGEFIHQQFNFKDNALTSKRINGSSRFETKSTIERVQVVGIPASPTSVTITSNGQTKDLQFVFSDTTRLLTIRRPEVNAGSDWVINVR